MVSLPHFLPTPISSCRKGPLLTPVTAFYDSYCYISKYCTYTVISSFANLDSVYWFPATLFYLTSLLYPAEWYHNF